MLVSDVFLFEKSISIPLLLVLFASSCFNAFLLGKMRKPRRTLKLTQSAITCSKLTIKTLEQGVKYVQS